jgi:hypothetical protein
MILMALVYENNAIFSFQWISIVLANFKMTVVTTDLLITQTLV